MSFLLQYMPYLEQHALTILICIPFVGALLLSLPFFSKERDAITEMVALLFSVLALSFASMLFAISQSTSAMQFKESVAWLPSFGVEYSVGADGLSLVLVLLTTVIMPLVIIFSTTIKEKRRWYLVSMLCLEGAILGALVALDLFLFYVFWELMLIPMYFIIGIWGGEKRIHATVKFVLFTMFGSFLMLIAIFYLVWVYYLQVGKMSFALADLMNTVLTTKEELWLFLAFALAFGIKVPVFLLHTWLPDAHVEAPSGGSVVLAAILLKLGVYGFFRFAFPLFPRAALECAPYLAVLGVAGIVYGALVAFAQSDIKKMIAYSSVSHLGYCVLGLAALTVLSLDGVIFQMLSHGFITGALFFLVGMLYERRHTRQISEYGGLATQMPLFATFFMVFTLGAIALPLTSGFIGECLILAGSFPRFQCLTTLALIGVVMGAVYMLTLYKRLWFGKLDSLKNGKLSDLSSRELLCLTPLAILVILLGVFPQPIVDLVSPVSESLIVKMNVRKMILNSATDESLKSKELMEDAFRIQASNAVLMSLGKDLKHGDSKGEAR